MTTAIYKSRALALACALTTVCAINARAQSTVPVRTLSAPDATSVDHFGTILNVRALSSGKMLINDGARRQLSLLDAGLGHRTVVIDSVSVGGQSYGPRATPLLAYLADSSLFVDGASLSLILITPGGAIGRVISAPKPSDLYRLAFGASGVDDKGNLVYKGGAARPLTQSADRLIALKVALTPEDSQPIVRANFDTRAVDTLIRVMAPNSQRVSMVTTDGITDVTIFQNPIMTFDEWAVLSDGSIAVVRGHDYRVDVLQPDGKLVSSARLPFDWRRLTDADKQALVDSARQANYATDAGSRSVTGVGGGKTGVSSAAAEKAAVATMKVGSTPVNAPIAFRPYKFEWMTLGEIVDYYPPIRAGAAKADLDGNLWILPTTSAQSTNGELVYDVVNNRAEMTERVRIPLGRAIAGFGRGGIVYLMYMDGTSGWLLERTRVVTGAMKQ